MSRGGAEGEGEREKLKQAPQPAQNPTKASISRPELKSRIACLTN